jgi:hypothetical protein
MRPGIISGFKKVQPRLCIPFFAGEPAVLNGIGVVGHHKQRLLVIRVLSLTQGRLYLNSFWP